MALREISACYEADEQAFHHGEMLAVCVNKSNFSQSIDNLPPSQSSQLARAAELASSRCPRTGALAGREARWEKPRETPQTIVTESN